MLALCRSHLPVVSSAGCPERCPSDLQSVGDQSYTHTHTHTLPRGAGSLPTDLHHILMLPK